MEISNDTLLQLIVAILGIGVAVLTYFLQLRKKSISYQIVSETPLLTIQEDIERKIVILFEEKPIRNVHLVVLRILNDGNVSILVNDFHESLSFSFGKETTILSAEITETLPKTFKPEVTTVANGVVFQPTLLNNGDVATIKLLLAGYDKKIKCDARVVGIKDIKKINETFNLSGVYPAIGLVISITGIILLSLLFYFFAHVPIGQAFRNLSFVPQFTLFVALIVGGLSTVLWGIRAGVRGQGTIK